MTKTCENCQWAKRTEHHDKPVYACHFNPPQVAFVQKKYALMEYMSLVSEWPLVALDDYCSHFQPRVEESS